MIEFFLESRIWRFTKWGTDSGSHLIVNNRRRITTARRKHGKRKTSWSPRVQRTSVCSWIQSSWLSLHAVLTLFSYHNACLVLDVLRGTPLRTDGDPSGFHRARRDQQTPHKHRETRNAQAEGGVDISTLPDNVTRIVVRSKQLTPR